MKKNRTKQTELKEKKIMAQVPVLIDQKADTIPYLATGDKAAGDVVLLGTIPAVVKRDIDFSENPLGTVTIGAAGEVWMVPQKAEIIADGAAVYWDPTGDPVTGTAGTGAATGTATDNLIGTAAAVQMNGTTDTAATDGYVLVIPNVAKRTATLCGRLRRIVWRLLEPVESRSPEPLASRRLC